jgi:AraC-like DNA-binding protein
MGYALHRVEGIGAPFLVVHEQVVLIPRSGCQRVDNKVRKLIFILQGECGHRLAGVGGKSMEVTLRAGDVMVLPHAHPHEYLSPVPYTSYRLHALRLAFDPTCVPPLTATGTSEGEGTDPETDLAAFVCHHFREFHHLVGGQDAPVRELLSQMREEAHQQLPGYRFRVGAICTGLVTLLARQVAAQRPGRLAAAHDHRAHHVSIVKDFLLRHLEQDLNLRDVAAHVQLSEEYLARLFKQATGQTVFDYLRRARFEQAKTLLSTSELNVTEISQRSGFGSVAAFSRSFKRELGISPSAYRSQTQRELG